MRHAIILSMLFFTACASTEDRYQDEVDQLQKQIRQLKRERDAAREDYDADVSRAFRRDQLDRRFPYSGMPDAPDWQKQRSREADEAEYNALLKEQQEHEARITHISTETGVFPVQDERDDKLRDKCLARPVMNGEGKIVGYRRVCFGGNK
jgi:outer membrane murein-binding lipoprotein Lpp